MRKILITGGAGFIGSALVRYIINETSDAVIVVDKLTYAGNLMSLAPVAQSERFATALTSKANRWDIRGHTNTWPGCWTRPPERGGIRWPNMPFPLARIRLVSTLRKLCLE